MAMEMLVALVVHPLMDQQKIKLELKNLCVNCDPRPSVDMLMKKQKKLAVRPFSINNASDAF